MQDYKDSDLYNEACDLKINSIIINEIGEDSLPGCANTMIWNTNYKPSIEKIEKDLSQGIISKETATELYNKIPIRPILPDDYQDKDKEITIKNCIDKSIEWIYSRLFKLVENNNNKNTNSNVNNSLSITNTHPSHHDNWEEINELPDGAKESISKQQEFILKRLLEENESFKFQGNIPNYLKELLNKILNPPKPVFNYKSFLKKWTTIYGNLTLVKTTRFKPNLIIEEGRRIKLFPDKHIICFLDTSGSMDKTDLTESLTELYNIKKITGLKITVAEIDAQVHNVWELKSLSQMNEYLSTTGISGRGGTVFTPGVEYLNDKKNNNIAGAIYFTDGYVSVPDVNSKKNILVVSTSNGRLLDWDTWDKHYTCIQIPKNYFNNNN